MLPDPRPYFAELSDPRRETRNKLHKLNDMLMIVFCAVLSGIEDWMGMEEFGKQKSDSDHRRGNDDRIPLLPVLTDRSGVLCRRRAPPLGYREWPALGTGRAVRRRCQQGTPKPLG